MPGDRFASYLLQSVIDEDPTTKSFKAISEIDSKPVCLKLLSQALTQHEGFTDALRIQLQAAKSLNHAGLAAFSEMGIHEGNHFLAFEWSSGGWLSHVLAQNGKLPLAEGLHIISKCAEILEGAAKKSIYHLNLKPTNILLSAEHGIRIADVGFAAAVRTMCGAANIPVYLGTTKFLAPEVMEPGVVDHRADIYSLGIIFYYILLNVIPFRFEGQKLTVQEENANLMPEQVLHTIAKMTERNPRNRYQDYESLLEQLRHLRALHGQLGEVPQVTNLFGRGIKTPDLFKLLCALFVSSSSGTLTVTSGEWQRTFYVSNREVIFFESNRVEDSIWGWLVKKREIDQQNKPEDWETFQGALNRLISKNLIGIDDFKYRFKELLTHLLSDTLKWESVDAEFANAEIKNEPLVVIRLSDVLQRAVKLCVDFSEILDELRPDTVLFRTSLFESVAPQFQFGPEESLLITRSQQGIHLGTLLVTAGTVDEKTMRFLYLMKHIGVLKAEAMQRQEVMESSEKEEETPEPISVRIEKPVVEMTETPDAVRIEQQRKQVSIERLDYEAERRFQSAREAYENKKFWEAANLCEQALGIHEDARYYWLMGLAYAHHPKFRNKAEDSFHSAICMDPLNDELQMGLAEFYLERGLFLRAKTHCYKALEILPGHERAVAMIEDLNRMNLGAGGCLCEHKPGCTHKH